jgi:hypothetical protein
LQQQPGEGTRLLTRIEQFTLALQDGYTSA